jgi:hypothetical protein
MAALAAIAASVAPDAASAAQTHPNARSPDSGTRTLKVRISPRQLGLPADASVRRLAREALQRRARRVGLPPSLRGLRFARELRLPGAPRGAAELRSLRFQQTVHGLRVVWSRIDVTVTGRTVRSIRATVVPVRADRLAGKRRISQARALRIARRRVLGREQALRPQLLVYAGKPTTRRSRWRTPRLAYVVEALPASEFGKHSPIPLCVVVDANSGRVVATWRGTVARTHRGARQGRAVARGPRGRSARASAQQTTLIRVGDAGGQVPSPPNVPPLVTYAIWNPVGDPFTFDGWPGPGDAFYPNPDPAARTLLMDNVTANARDVVLSRCVGRAFCGRDGGYDGSFNEVRVNGNVGGHGSFTIPTSLAIYLSQFDVADAGRRNDVLAHEYGHLMDYVLADDREATPQGAEVQEGLADMFAYDYDFQDPWLGEPTGDGVIRDWAKPGNETGPRGGPYPARMRDYTCPSSSSLPHHNSTILSHAYYLFRKRVGRLKAGNVLLYISWFLAPKPRYVDVKNGFITRSGELYPYDDPGDANNVSEVAERARATFVSAVGIGWQVPATGPCE